MAQITLVGSYNTSNFHVVSGNGGTVEIVDPAGISVGASTTLAFSEDYSVVGDTVTPNNSAGAAAIALLGHYMAASFAAPDDALTPPAQPLQAAQPLLTGPPHHG